MSLRRADDLAAQSMQALDARLEIPADLEAVLLDQVAGDLTARSMQALESELVIPADLEATLLDRVAGSSYTRATKAIAYDDTFDGDFFKGSSGSTKHQRISKRTYLRTWIGSIAFITAIWLQAAWSRSVQLDSHSNEQDASQSEGAQLLKQVQEKLIANDIDGAHEFILHIPSSSLVLDDPIIKTTETTWAITMFTKLEQTPQNEQKKAILRSIADTPTVDSWRRQKATDRLQEILTAETRVAMAEPTHPSSRTLAPQNQRPSIFSKRRKSASAFDGVLALEGDESRKPLAADSLPAPHEAETPSLALIREREALEKKVFGGYASVDEIRKLVTICSSIGDLDCRDRAIIELRGKESFSSPH